MEITIPVKKNEELGMYLHIASDEQNGMNFMLTMNGLYVYHYKGKEYVVDPSSVANALAKAVDGSQ